MPPPRRSRPGATVSSRSATSTTTTWRAGWGAPKCWPSRRCTRDSASRLSRRWPPVCPWWPAPPVRCPKWWATPPYSCPHATSTPWPAPLSRSVQSAERHGARRIWSRGVAAGRRASPGSVWCGPGRALRRRRRRPLGVGVHDAGAVGRRCPSRGRAAAPPGARRHRHLRSGVSWVVWRRWRRRTSSCPSVTLYASRSRGRGRTDSKGLRPPRDHLAPARSGADTHVGPRSLGAARVASTSCTRCPWRCHGCHDRDPYGGVEVVAYS